jgi:hypothetical protein
MYQTVQHHILHSRTSKSTHYIISQVYFLIVKMKLLQSTFALSILFEVSHAFALPKDYEPDTLARGLLERRQNTRVVQDCGTWQMKCKNAAGACNNACYHVKCAAKNNKYVQVLGSNKNKPC